MKLNRRINILLVEDDEVDVMNVQRSFQKQAIPHHLDIVRDGMEALDWLRRTGAFLPQVILLDINMPRMNGLEFLQELRADPVLKHLMVYVMSTSSNPEDKRKAHQHNVAAYMVKPLSMEEFSHSLTCLMRVWDICEFP